jgi:hypothetical protein
MSKSEAMMRTPIPRTVREEVLRESRRQCSICGAKSYLHLCHMRSFYLGGTNESQNLIVLCPTCHSMVDRAAIPEEVLVQVKKDWVEEGFLGRDAILDYCKSVQDESTSDVATYPEHSIELDELQSWSQALRKYREFDRFIEKIVEEIKAIPSEDDFIERVLKPLFEALGFEGVTVVHHTGRPERGKDIVFFDRDRLGSLTFYAVVATINRVHAKSSKPHDSGHYQKMIEQVSKCYHFPYKDYNLKGEFFIDKVIVATAETISEEAQEALGLWEQAERRHLIYLSGPDIAGMLLKLGVGSLAGEPFQGASLQRAPSYSADIRLAVVKQDFRSSIGISILDPRPRFRGVKWNPRGHDKQGIPDCGSLWARIEITNAGLERGLLEWEPGEPEQPLLFDADQIHFRFFAPASVEGRRLPFTRDLFVYIPFTEQDPQAFAQAMRALIESQTRYKITIRYWTKGVEGKSEARELPIEGDFRGFHQKMLEQWGDSGFRNLAEVARVTDHRTA